MGYHPDYNLAKEFYYCRNTKGFIWDFSIYTSPNLKYQVFTVLNYALESSSGRELRRGYLAPLRYFYMYCIDEGISDLTQLEQNQIDEYIRKAKAEPLVKNRYHQIVDKVQRILFIEAKDINWEANVWYLERFQFDVTRYNPTRPVKRISFLDIKREGYYLKEGVAWLRIYQHKMKMEKVIPIPMLLYRSIMVYIERRKIGLDSYVFQNSKGGPYLSTHYWHEMVDWCNGLGIKCGDYVFQTHDYRHSVAAALYEHGASIQAIREFLGHKHENMTRRYIDCIQRHVDRSSEQYYKEQKSLASEWKEGSGEDGS